MDNRPDFSNHLVHFTKGGRPCSQSKFNPAIGFTNKKSARNRLISILEGRKICAATLPWINKSAICFTECVWSSLLAHSKVYSCYGIGFSKSFIYNHDGNPAFYVRPSVYKNQQWANEVNVFTTPFCPNYGSEVAGKDKYIDYSHEREWRIPHDLEFTYDDIEFVVVKSQEDLAHMKRLVSQIGIKKFLFMSNYEKIEELWPVHRVAID